jgi:hypothetical protein
VHKHANRNITILFAYLLYFQVYALQRCHDKKHLCYLVVRTQN